MNNKCVTTVSVNETILIFEERTHFKHNQKCNQKINIDSKKYKNIHISQYNKKCDHEQVNYTLYIVL